MVTKPLFETDERNRLPLLLASQDALENLIVGPELYIHR